MVELDPAKQLAALKDTLAAGGITEATKDRLASLLAQMLAQGMALGAKAPEVVSQVQGLADELAVSSRDNREMLAGLIHTEVERVAGRMGYVREDELAALRAQVQRLQTQVDELRGERPAPAVADMTAPDMTAPDATTLDATTPTEPKPKKKIYLNQEPQA